MTTVPKSPRAQLVDLSPDELRARLNEAVALYVAAMRYPHGTEEQRAPMWAAHMQRDGWRCVAAFDRDDRLAGICYGYRGAPDQWWHEQVRRGITQLQGPAVAAKWLRNYFELTELHVRPDCQGQGTGEDLLRQLLAGARARNVLLSTPEGITRAWRLYRRTGFRDVLRDYRFTGDPRPFAVLGRPLPL